MVEIVGTKEDIHKRDVGIRLDEWAVELSKIKVRKLDFTVGVKDNQLSVTSKNGNRNFKYDGNQFVLVVKEVEKDDLLFSKCLEKISGVKVTISLIESEEALENIPGDLPDVDNRFIKFLKDNNADFCDGEGGIFSITNKKFDAAVKLYPDKCIAFGSIEDDEFVVGVAFEPEEIKWAMKIVKLISKWSQTKRVDFKKKK